MSGLVKQIHWFIILYVLWGAYGMYEEHNEQMESLNSQVEVMNNKIRKAKRDQKRLEEYHRNIEEAKQKIETVARKVEKLQAQLPNEVNEEDIKQSLEMLTSKLNVRNFKMESMGDENKGFYFAKRLKVTIEATYLQLLIFLEKLEQYDRILNVISVKIDKKVEKQKGSFKLTKVEMIVETYRYNSAHKERREIVTPAAKGAKK